MQTSYIYSVSKANALSESLLNRTDIERLLVAQPGEDLQSALKETAYLAPYIVQVPDENVALAIEKNLIHAKKLIYRVAPQGEIFRIMWMQYDIHNLRVITKAMTGNHSFADYKSLFSERGIYTPSYLLEHAENGTLNRLQLGWQDSYDEALEIASTGDISSLDGVFDSLYFTTSKRLVEKANDPFMRTYLQTLIDLYNLKSRLRHLQNRTVQFTPTFVDGGTFAQNVIETIDQTIAKLYQFGDEAYWETAVQQFQTTGNFTHLDSKSADYLLMTARNGSYDMFSPASLVLYYLKCRQSAANVRTIVVGKNSGLTADQIRSNLRLAYVNN